MYTTPPFEDLEKDVYVELIRLYFSRNPAYILYHIIFSLVFFLIVQQHAPFLDIIIWLTLSLILHGQRYHYLKNIDVASILTFEQAKRSQNQSIIVACLQGGLIGLGTVYFFPYLPIFNQVGLIILMVVITSSLLVSSAQDSVSFYTAMALISLPTITQCLFWGDKIHMFFGASGALFVFMVLQMYSWHHKSLQQSVRLQFMNKSLASSLEMSNKVLEEMSITDTLTRLGNRRFFDQVLDREWSRARRNRYPISMIMLDIDHFKAYNDYYGHLDGDVCLKTIAAIIKNAVSRPSDYAIRYGGEEFAIILADTDMEGAEKVAAAIQTQISKQNVEHKGAGASGRITVSMGIATMVPDNNSNTDELISGADQALYAAKQGGRSRIILAGKKTHMPCD